MKKGRTFRETFRSMRNFLELQRLVDNLVDFLELSMPRYLSVLFDEVKRGPEHEKKPPHFVKYHLYRYFLKKTLMGDLK